ncbi:MAG: thioredoxin domain-containing protein [Gammaproteobacteria bacterium HGW-Gammaproteobacteria-8]|nr:MAG: thioredoxin domain-containing protein [Gammaproteobacteria bacterium HGW-Gammaproteobacteria-8]
MSNRLSDCLSPYLQQHAEQPVAWQPWDGTALSRARTEDRPILLSIGYSACHWCHVMSRESFEDPDIAQRMNAWFVNIKVDREERPDLDRIYQLAHQLLTGRGGGWPLTLFLDPGDLTPFVAGTYFPPRSRAGQIGFDELLERVHAAWSEQRGALESQNAQLRQALELLSSRRLESSNDAWTLAAALVDQLQARFDRRHGGFGSAPKFPQVPLLDFLLGAARTDPDAASMLVDTLRAMARNGLQDQLGGGFFRYCVDAAWEIPHFEKLLGDNAQLLAVYAEAAQRWDDPELAAVAQACAAFLERDLQLPAGGLASSLDADSLAEDAEPDQLPSEGEFYLWTPEQFDAVLDPPQAALARARWGLDGPANFDRRWHLLAARDIGELTGRAEDSDATRVHLDSARGALLARRQQRPRPARDDKMLASGNALAVLGLVRAGRALRCADWIERADALLQLVLERHFGGSRPAAVWRDGRSASPALLDDHAASLLAILELLQHRWDGARLGHAVQLSESIQRRFLDPDSGRLFLTPYDHEPLLMRPGAGSDDAAPAGAALTIRAWSRLAHLLGEPRWASLAEHALAAESGTAEQAPMAHASLIAAGQELARPPIQVLIGGADSLASEWHARLLQRGELHCYRVPVPDDTLAEPLASVSRWSKARAVVCRASRCSAPLDHWQDIAAAIELDTGADHEGREA